jgi:hypothetical protein
VYWSVRNCIVGCVHTHAAGLGISSPATSILVGSSVAVEFFHFDWSTGAAGAAGALAPSPAAAGAEGAGVDGVGVEAAGAEGAEGTATGGVGGFGFGFS